MILGLLVGLASFVLWLLGHAIIIQTVAAPGRPKATQLAFLVGLAAIPVSLWLAIAEVQNPVLTQGGSPLGTLCGILLYGGLFSLYMPFYYVVIASLSVRTIVMLSRHPELTLPLAALRSEFVSSRLVGQRLNTMVDNGFLRPTPRGYVLTGKGRHVARVFDVLKRFWKLGAGG